ncbi:TraR/DksA family transcriptional regulator [Pseudodesulfovibrio tunisiensis]|uniref:TraR/DksA family transcriptional regulator n=1 Tax=Pseudodesulfovibrio tunisiensis TaxID=463192 RepID=UPI001FB4FA23|nr:TraR/DksA C4-type zinc finger protein [Pseudodesulfovibrio tunisiensis]
MDKHTRKEFKARALNEIENLRQEIPRLKEQLKPVAPDNAIGRLSRMDTIVNQSVVEVQLGKARTRLLRLEEAVRRAEDDPDFGLCEDCGEPIPLARLMAMPETALCVHCAE